MDSVNKARMIVILITGLTMGHKQYKAGDLIPEAQATKDLIDFANGKELLGKRWAKWVEAPKPAPEPEAKAESEPASEAAAANAPLELERAVEMLVEAGNTESMIVGFLVSSGYAETDAREATALHFAAEQPEELPELPDNVTAVDLDEAIKELVKAGNTKTAIVKELGALEDVSQREVREEFDKMLATGVIVAGETAGAYSLGE